MDEYEIGDPFVDFLTEGVSDDPEFTFEHNLGTVTARDRVSSRDSEGQWIISYQNPRTARIADDGTLVHYITDHCYFAYRDAFAFHEKRDTSCLAFVEPLSFSVVL